MKARHSLFLLFVPVLFACSEDDGITIPENKPDNIIYVDKVAGVDIGIGYQTIEGFGASDCWMPSFVGKYWTTHRESIARLLFSKEMKDGQPQGIGLSMWRTNLGGGSAQQGDASGIADFTRRAESYLNDDLTYDWNRCEGQRYFLDRAKEYGLESLVLFSNTPPVQLTKNGRGYSENWNHANLKDDCYDDFAAYMAEVDAHYRDAGYPVTHISPVNEPQYNWDGADQEGSGWQNEEVARLVRELDTQLTRKNADTKILLGEAGNWRYLYRIEGEMERSKMMDAFFNTSSKNYVGNLKHVPQLISGHSYWTDDAWDGMRKVRRNTAREAEKYNVSLWQTEWSMLGDEYSENEFVGYDNATEMDIALYMAKVIHNDLTQAKVTSWSFWTAMDVPRWGHKNRFLLIALHPKNDDISNEGTFQACPTLWVLGNYSRFIRPGYQRIDLNHNESQYFFGSAWISPEGDELVTVYANLSDHHIRLNEEHEGWTGGQTMVYTTTAIKALEAKKIPVGEKPILEPKSVTTIVSKLK